MSSRRRHHHHHKPTTELFDNPTNSKEEEESPSSHRKKSVHFDEDQMEAPPANKSRSNSTSSSPTKPVLKKLSDAEEISKFSKKMTQVKLLLQRLKKGDSMTKYYDGGATRKRHFYVSDDGSELRWCSTKFKGISRKIVKNSSLVLAEVRGIVFGPRTERFSQYDWLKSHPYNCFSIICERRTLDIECKNREQFMVWFLGLQALSPLSHKFWNRGQLNWHRALYKTLQLAGNSGKDISVVWKELVELSRKQIKAEIAMMEEENRRILDEEDRPVRRKSSLKEDLKEDPSVSEALKRVLHGDTSVGSVAIRERLAREAMSLQSKNNGKSDYEPSATTTKYESTTETLSRKHSDDLDEKDESKGPVDLSILTAPIDPSRFQKKHK